MESTDHPFDKNNTFLTNRLSPWRERKKAENTEWIAVPRGIAPTGLGKDQCKHIRKSAYY